MEDNLVFIEVENKKYDTKKKRNQYRRHCRDRFIKKLFASGELNCINAKRGRLPRGYNIHHIVPLSLNGDNSFDNFCVIDEDLHNKMNEHIIDPQTHSGCDTVFMPAFKNKVVTKRNSIALQKRMNEKVK